MLTTGLAIALNFQGAAVPEWVQFMPAGPQLKGRDGREWRMPSASAVVAATKLPFALDFEHSMDLPGQGEPIASGWCEELQVRNGEIWGRVSWTPKATQRIADRECRFLSPVFKFAAATGEVIALTGAGLVARPNFEMTALNASAAAAVPQPTIRAGVNSMLINGPGLDALFMNFNFLYNEGLKGAKSHVPDIAYVTPSRSSEEIYPFLGQFPQLRKWIGDRVVKQLVLHGWSIKNEKFESTIAIKRETIEDDRYGAFAPMFKQLGILTKTHPDELVFPLLKTGFTAHCYDGEAFFSASHPVGGPDDTEATASNMQSGDGEPWFLLDTSQALRPLIWQERVKYEFQQMTASDNEHVFLRDEYVYGVRARVNAGFGLWQTAFGSKAPLNADNFAAARASMMSLKGDRGTILGINPNVLVVPPSLEAAARKLLKATSVADTVTIGGVEQAVPATNVWHESADLIVTPFLA
ncbi:MAG: Mu-like prophage major head subunit gpT family protein [Hyphomicrobiales bacterium]|nr:Mu-like prophage major head subunit gpT family protein [Amphiplicatus sp.]MCC2102573.1 Mu-like prophage major head subunit gpT family protein [Hyphomicrobiales bacterium]MCC2107453.1 Mu-like prophage major head subunit gpT family protein [Hyphomicrobiales bacterium]MCC2112843.1 Mu-like prophage major head subunit gpT family protein [Hyphomicrobiales bacterium]